MAEVLRFVVAVDPSEVPHVLRGSWTPAALRVFRNVKNAKTNKRRWRQPNVRLFELTYDPADGTPNALQITSEIE